MTKIVNTTTKMTNTAACLTQLRKNQPVVLKLEGLQTLRELIADEDVLPFENDSCLKMIL